MPIPREYKSVKKTFLSFEKKKLMRGNPFFLSPEQIKAILFNYLPQISNGRRLKKMKKCCLNVMSVTCETNTQTHPSPCSDYREVRTTSKFRRSGICMDKGLDNVKTDRQMYGQRRRVGWTRGRTKMQDRV